MRSSTKRRTCRNITNGLAHIFNAKQTLFYTRYRVPQKHNTKPWVIVDFSWWGREDVLNYVIELLRITLVRVLRIGVQNKVVVVVKTSSIV